MLSCLLTLQLHCILEVLASVPLTVIIFFVSCLIGFNLSIFMASVEIKILPDPVSKNAHNVSSFDTTGNIGGSVNSGDGA